MAEIRGSQIVSVVRYACVCWLLVTALLLPLLACQSQQTVEVTVEREVVRTVEVVREVEKEVQIVVTATSTPSEPRVSIPKRSDLSRPSEISMNYMREYRRFDLTAEYFDLSPELLHKAALADVMLDTLEDGDNPYRPKLKEYEPDFIANFGKCVGDEESYERTIECSSDGILTMAKMVGANVPDIEPSASEWQYFSYWENGLLGCLLEVRLVNNKTLEECHEKAHEFAVRDLDEWWEESRGDITDTTAP